MFEMFIQWIVLPTIVISEKHWEINGCSSNCVGMITYSTQRKFS